MKAFFSFLIKNGRRRNKKTCFFFFSDSSLLLDVYLLLLLLPDTHTHTDKSRSHLTWNFAFFFFSGVHSSRHGTFSFLSNSFFLLYPIVCIYNQPLIQRETSHFDNVLSYLRQKRLAIYSSSSSCFVRSFVRSSCIDDTDTIKNLRRCREITGLFDSHVINLSIWYFDCCWSLLLWRNQRRNHHHPSSSSFIYMERLEASHLIGGSSVPAFTADDCAFFK